MCAMQYSVCCSFYFPPLAGLLLVPYPFIYLARTVLIAHFKCQRVCAAVCKKLNDDDEFDTYRDFSSMTDV